MTSALEASVIRRACDVFVVSASGPTWRRRVWRREGVHVVPSRNHIEVSQQDRAAVRRRLGWGEDVVITLHGGNVGLEQGRQRQD